MRVDSYSIQRWCALTLEQYKDDANRRTTAGIQGAHVIPKAMGPKEVRPHYATYARLTYSLITIISVEKVSVLEGACGLKKDALVKAKDTSKNIMPREYDLASSLAPLFVLTTIRSR